MAKVHVYLSEETAARLADEAKKAGKSVSALIREAVERRPDNPASSASLAEIERLVRQVLSAVQNKAPKARQKPPESLNDAVQGLVEEFISDQEL